MKTLSPAWLLLTIVACGGDDDVMPTADVIDSNAADSSAVDSGIAQSDVADSNVPDSNVPDSNVPDSNVPDGASDVVEAPWWEPVAAKLTFEVQLFATGTPRSSAGGAIWSAPQPSGYLFQAESGPCRFSLGNNPFCDPDCIDGLCTAPNVCTRFPELLSAGALTVSIANAAPLKIRPTLQGYNEGQDVVWWAPGSEIAIAASGDVVPAFATQITMPAQLVGVDFAKLDLTKPLAFRWQTPPNADPEARIRIRLQSDRGQHGRAYASVLECDVPDTGSFDIPADIQLKYVDDGVWGCGKCPASSVTRYHHKRVDVGRIAVDIYAESTELFLLTPWTTPE